MKADRTLLIVALVLVPILSAGAAYVSVDRSDDFSPGSIKTVAFLPFARVGPPPGYPQAKCPLAGESFNSCKMEDAAEAELSRKIGQALLGSGAPVVWTPQSEINRVRKELKEEGNIQLDLSGSWQKAIAKELGVDAVMFGFVYCYRDRSGTWWASAEPAAIGFCLHLLDPDTGDVLWSYRYEDRQQALSENLLNLPRFIKRGGKWITIETMAEEGANSVIAALPWNRPVDKKEDPAEK